MSKRHIGDVVRGGGMFLALVNGLTAGIAKRGGHLEQLYYLTTRHGEKNLDLIVEYLLSLPWRVAKSELMRISRAFSIKEGNRHAVVASDERFFWEMGLREYGIPFVRFLADDGLRDYPNARSVEELRSELHGKKLQECMRVYWGVYEYYLVGISTGAKEVEEGDRINISNVDFIHLALTKYIDIEN